MAEYIKKEDIEQKIQDGLNNLVLGHDAIEVLGMIYEMPSADVAPVRHGEWEWFEEWIPGTTEHPTECEDCGWRCGNCKQTLEDMVGGYWDNPDERPQLVYCPNCGAKMMEG